MDDKQLALVESMESMVVDACPGAGKTAVLTAKASALMKRGKSLVCLCFTRAAAEEMALRVPGLPATTIHSLCCQGVGWKVLKGMTTNDAYSYLLYRFVREYEMKLDWVLVDEMQDLNPQELDVVLSLVGDKLFGVGDIYQSIFGFQGAIGSSVVPIFRKAGCKLETLKINYRSCPKVIDRLNGVYPRDLVSGAVKTTNLSAILCRSNRDVREVSDYLEENNIPHYRRIAAAYSEMGRAENIPILEGGSLIVSTIHAMKGQQVDNVVIYNWLPRSFDSEEETRVYYVALSRASKTVNEVYNLQSLQELVETW